jgi:IS5 family transposase
MQRIVKLAGGTGTALRDRTRTVRYRVMMEIGRASRSRIAQGQERLKACYAKLLHSTAVTGA